MTIENQMAVMPQGEPSRGGRFKGLWLKLLGLIGRGEGRPRAVKVDDIRPGAIDVREHRITKLYAKRSGEFAIFHTVDADGGVRIQYSDQSTQEALQRREIMKVSQLRVEVNALLIGVRRRDIYDKKIAVALESVIEHIRPDGSDDKGGNGTTNGSSLLQEVKGEVLVERGNVRRVRYFYLTLLSIFPIIYLLGYPTSVDILNATTDDARNFDGIWYGSQVGVVGAAFSIFLLISRRSDIPDPSYFGNLMDSIVRLLIGSIAGGAIVLILISGMLGTLTVGALSIDTNEVTIFSIFVAAFVAGFSERLVPDLLERTGGRTEPQTPSGSQDPRGAPPSGGPPTGPQLALPPPTPTQATQNNSTSLVSAPAAQGTSSPPGGQNP